MHSGDNLFIKQCYFSIKKRFEKSHGFYMIFEWNEKSVAVVETSHLRDGASSENDTGHNESGVLSSNYTDTKVGWLVG